MKCLMKTTFKVKQGLRFICVVVLMSCSSLAQEFTTCESGEVGVFVSMQYTDLNFPNGQVSWDIQDVDGNILADLEYLPIASNILWTSDEICLPEGEIYTFNTYDTGGDGWGFGSWYELSICGGNTTIINNSGSCLNTYRWYLHKHYYIYIIFCYIRTLLCFNYIKIISTFFNF